MAGVPEDYCRFHQFGDTVAFHTPNMEETMYVDAELASKMGKQFLRFAEAAKKGSDLPSTKVFPDKETITGE